jgi:hypothetical protein
VTSTVDNVGRNGSGETMVGSAEIIDTMAVAWDWSIVSAKEIRRSDVKFDVRRGNGRGNPAYNDNRQHKYEWSLHHQQ